MQAGSKVRPNAKTVLVSCALQTDFSETNRRTVRWPKTSRTLRVTLPHAIKPGAAFCYVTKASLTQSGAYFNLTAVLR